MGIGYRIKEARERMGITQKDLGELVGVTGSAITNYEKETSHPKEQIIYKLMDCLGVDANYLFQDVMRVPKQNNDVSLAEYEHIKKYRNLDQYGKETIDIILNREINRVKNIKELEGFSQKSSIPRRIFAYYGKIAAAGVGVDFSDMIAGTKEYYITEDNKNADYTIGVSGNSMEDTYYDGDIVFVKKQSHINVGDVGIFQKNNMIYIKEAGENGLFSYNTKYDPMIDESEVICLGKVIGKVTDDMIIREND